MMQILTAAFTALLILLPAGVQAQSQGELRVAIPWTPENLDPTMNLSSFRAMVGVSIFDSLVGRGCREPHRAPARGVMAPRRRGHVAAQASPGRRLPRRRALQCRGRCASPSSGCSIRSRNRPTAPTWRRSCGWRWWTTTRSTSSRASPMRPSSTGSWTSPSCRPSTSRRKATRAWPCARWAQVRTASSS
jgi:hypothetical protein